MEPTTSTVVQPTATFRIQVSPGPIAKASYRAATEESAAPASGTQPSYTWNAFLNDKPVFDKALDLPLERLISRSGLEHLRPHLMDATGTLLPRVRCRMPSSQRMNSTYSHRRSPWRWSAHLGRFWMIMMATCVCNSRSMALTATFTICPGIPGRAVVR